MTSLGYLNLSQVEKRDILAHYAVTPMLKPVLKGAPKAESLASSAVLQSSVSLQQPELHVEARRDSLPKVEEKP